MIHPLLLAVSLARAQEAQPAASIPQLKAVFIESTDDKAKVRALSELARTAPASANDVESLYDLFMRFPIDEVRGPVLGSLERLRPDVPGTETLLLRSLDDDDPASELFGLKGAETIQLKDAVPFVRKIAQRKFKYSTLEKAVTVDDRNRWSVQFEALAALAQLQGGRAVPLLEKKAQEAPQVARLMAEYAWPQALPTLVRWYSGSTEERLRAIEGLDADVAPAQLQPARARMLEIVGDEKADPELRHRLAAKVGLCSTHDEVTALLKSHDAAADPYTKRLYAAAAFASRDAQVVPLLVKFAKEDPTPNVRAGALVQLKEMLPAADYRAVLEWAAKNDPDQDNREVAQKELKVLRY